MKGKERKVRKSIETCIISETFSHKYKRCEQNVGTNKNAKGENVDKSVPPPSANKG